MDSVRAKHAAELEAKRKKLEEIRKRKASVRCVCVGLYEPQALAGFSDVSS